VDRNYDHIYATKRRLLHCDLFMGNLITSDLAICMSRNVNTVVEF
jgi:hypothetical protein